MESLKNIYKKILMFMFS